MKKIFITIFILVSICFGIFKIFDINYYKYKACQEGDTSKWKFSDNKAYELALDYQGLPIFRNPEKALNQLKKDYKEAIKTLKKEYNISFTLNKYNYNAYYVHGWQINTDDEKLRDQCIMVTKILGFYDNSIIKKT